MFIPNKIYEYAQPRWNDIDRNKQKNKEKNMPKCQCDHHTSHTD